MALSVTREYVSLGNRQGLTGEIAFDSSYPVGGESFDPAVVLGLHTLETILFEDKDGYKFEYDASTKKVKAYWLKKVPPIIYEEHQVMDTSYGITLTHPAAFIMNVAKVGENQVMRSTAVAALGVAECCLAAQLALGEASSMTFGTGTTMVSNGTFTGNATGWTLAAGWTYATNAVDKDGDGTGTLAEDAFAAVIGHTYEVKFTISNWTVGSVTPTCGGTAGTAVSADGSYTQRIKATTTGGILFTPTNTARFTIDAISVVDCDVYVTYVTQAWREVWDNLVQDESITLATGANTLASGNKIAACMYIDQITATAAALTMIDSDDTVASGEVDLLLNSATAQLTVHGDQNAKVAKCTYLKVPASGFLYDRLVTNQTAVKSGGDPYVSTFAYPIMLWGYTGCMPINGAATLRLIDYPSTPATGEAVPDWFALAVRGAGALAGGMAIGTKDNVTGSGAGIWGRPWEIPTVDLPVNEVADGTDLSAITALRYFAVGL